MKLEPAVGKTDLIRQIKQPLGPLTDLGADVEDSPEAIFLYPTEDGLLDIPLAILL